MLFPAEALRVNLVNGFRARRPCGKPSVCCGNLDAADRLAIPGGISRDRDRLLTRKISRVNVPCGDVFKSCLLLIGRRCFRSAIKRLAQLCAEFGIELAGVILTDCSNFSCEQRGNDPILVRGPN